MALSFDAVKKAYEALHEVKQVWPELSIFSFPPDMANWPESKQENPPLNHLIGSGQKSDSGWESLVFFVRNPTSELKTKFLEVKGKVPNSSIAKPYRKNESIWIFGWF